MAKRPTDRPDEAEACREALLQIARAYSAATGLALATVSRQFHGQQSFLGEFEAGECSITLSKMKVMLSGFREKWPPGIPWPAIDPVRFPAPPRKGRKISKKVGEEAANV